MEGNVVEANPGERTGGEKDKDALHRTPAQRAKRCGPGPDEEVKDAEMMPEHGAQGSGENLGGDLRGGDAAGIEGEQHGLSNAPLGRKEGGVEPRSPVLGSEKQACRQEGATIVADPTGQKGMSARNAHESRGTHLGVMMPMGTANEQPIPALTRALGAKGSALPEAVQTTVQIVQSAAHVDMRGADARTAPGITDTPQGGMLSKGTENAQPEQAPTRAPGAKGSALPEAVQTIVQIGQSAAHVDMRGTDASTAPGITDTPQGGMLSKGTANAQPEQALTRAPGAKGSALPEAVQTIVQIGQSAAHVGMRGTDASMAPELTGTPLEGTMPPGTANVQPNRALPSALGAMGRALPYTTHHGGTPTNPIPQRGQARG